MRGRMVSLSMLAVLAACSNQAPSDSVMSSVNFDASLIATENLVMNVTQNDVTAVSAPLSEPTRPRHRYDFRDGDLYGYIAAISEDERKSGKAAGSVVTYRYTGFRDLAYRLEIVDGGGRTVGYSECGRPCVAIKTRYNGLTERIAFNSNSIAGAAFQDAMNGLLEAPRPKPEPKIPDPYEGYNSVQEFREAVPENIALEGPVANEE